MPIKPTKPILQFTCIACGWTWLKIQRTDVIFAPHECKQCGSLKFSLKAQSFLEAAVSDPVGLFKILRNRGWMVILNR